MGKLSDKRVKRLLEYKEDIAVARCPYIRSLFHL